MTTSPRRPDQRTHFCFAAEKTERDSRAPEPSRAARIVGKDYVSSAAFKAGDRVIRRAQKLGNGAPSSRSDMENIIEDRSRVGLLIV